MAPCVAASATNTWMSMWMPLGCRLVWWSAFEWSIRLIKRYINVSVHLPKLLKINAFLLYVSCFLCFIVKYGETAAPERGHRWKLADNTALCKRKAGWIIKEIGGREAYKRSVRESFWKCKAVRGPIPNCPWRGSCFVCFSVLLPGNREWDSQSQCRLSPLHHCF